MHVLPWSCMKISPSMLFSERRPRNRRTHRCKTVTAFLFLRSSANRMYHFSADTLALAAYARKVVCTARAARSRLDALRARKPRTTRSMDVIACTTRVMKARKTALLMRRIRKDWIRTAASARLRFALRRRPRANLMARWRLQAVCILVALFRPTRCFITTDFSSTRHLPFGMQLLQCIAFVV